ncbi:hypothetical protein HZ326_15761 [Fusarium oxysporum f. sp. albedinis]|nr:hypothetical protein HZ326_15761 [Fusarium oxysporum f. sp. albedinis]
MRENDIVAEYPFGGICDKFVAYARDASDAIVQFDRYRIYVKWVHDLIKMLQEFNLEVSPQVISDQMQSFRSLEHVLFATSHLRAKTRTIALIVMYIGHVDSQSYPFSLLCRLLKTNPSDLASAALKVFTDVAKEKFKAAIAKEEEEEKKALKSTVED